MTDDLRARGQSIVDSGKYRPTVLDEVERFARRFLALPSEESMTAVVLWIAHTWCVGAFYVTPRLVIDSAEPGSGKTRLLEILALLCRGAKLTLSTTTAALYRRIAEAGETPPTILQDESDALFGRMSTPQTEDLRALYNSGYKRGATVDRCESDNKGKIRVREFPVFAPAALAGLAGRMPATITDRAVTIHMRRRAPDEELEDYRERDAAPKATAIRDRLEAWTAENATALEECRPQMPHGVRDRPAEVWEALLAVAETSGGMWPERARAACRHFVLDRDADALSFGARLLRDVRDAFADQDRMFSAELVEALKADPESEWRDLWGKELDQRRLAKELKRYGVESQEVRIGTVNRKGYLVSGDNGLAQAWHRYLTPVPMRDTRYKGDIAGQSVADSDRMRDNRDASATPETSSEQDLFGAVASVADVAHTPHPRGRPQVRPRFRPPAGPDRCPSCGWHIESMGHADDCPTANEEKTA